MNPFDFIESLIRAEIAALAEAGDFKGVPPDYSFTVEPPRQAAHGDVAVNIAMVLAKPLARKPREIAEALAKRLRRDNDVAAVAIAGPGFLNLQLSDLFWHKVLQSVLQAGDRYGAGVAMPDSKVNVEYVSANPTGPMHIGHCRGAVFGDALANLLEFAGHDVTREYYINDAGAQVDMLARSAYLRYREACGEKIGAIAQGLYPGDYLKPVGAALKEKYGDALLSQDEQTWLDTVRAFAVAAMMAMIRDDLAALNISHDVFFSEKGLSEGPDGGAIGRVVAEMRDRGLVYEGRLPPPKGKPPEDWEDREQTLFRASDYGDDADRALVKFDGGYTYFASDVAYMKSKFDRGFNRMIFVLGADHGGYVKRLEAAGKAISGGTVEVQALLCQLVRLYRDGKPYKMSKRAGSFISLREVVDEVGRDCVRFMMLYRRNDAPLDFDFAKVTEQSKDNPVFYVQYAHARICSVFRNAAAAGIAMTAGDPALLGDEAELALIKKLAEYPRLIEAAARAAEPHRLAFYLYDLAALFHGLWNKGREQPELRFILEDNPALSQARLALLKAVQHILRSGLKLAGADAPEEMR